MITLNHIPISLEPEEIKSSLHIEQTRDWDFGQTLIETAQSLISARAAYKVCFIEAKLKGAMSAGSQEPPPCFKTFLVDPQE